MHEKYILSTQMQQFITQCESYFPDDIVTKGVQAQREAYNAMTASFARQDPASLVITDQKINGVNTRRYQPKDTHVTTTILYAHGGGWYLGGLDSHHSFCADIANICQVCVIAVDYRLAPEFTYPAGLEDCFGIYKTLLQQGITPMLMGDSAGANCMAALTLRCKEEAITQARAQILIYPALALPHSLPSHQDFSDAPLLSSDGVEFCLQSYIPHCYDYSQVPALFPLQATSHESLPCAAIFAAQYDPLIDDARLYSQRLQNAGVKADCMIIQGLVHGALHAIGQCDEANELLDSICKKIITFKKAESQQ